VGQFPVRINHGRTIEKPGGQERQI
jgi:hypothetical protein